MSILDELTEYDEPPTKPLVEQKEVKETARKALLNEVNGEIARLAHNETVNEQILQVLEQQRTVLDEIKEIITKNSEENSQTLALKLDVLNKLKTKLEIV